MGEIVPWGEWKPDVSAYKGSHSPTITNAFPRGDGYGPVPSFAGLTDALPAACRGFFVAFDDDGTISVFAGTATRLYKLSNSDYSWGDVSKSDASALSLSGSTSIGDLTGGGNLAAAFDADTTQAAAACAAKAAATTGYVGKTFAAAAPIHTVKVYGSNDAGYVSAITPEVTIKLYGKNGTAPANGTDGTLLATLTPFTDTADESTARTITSSDQNTSYLHAWVYITHNGVANQINVAELEFFSADDYAVASTHQWQFAQFGTRVIAVNGADAPQSYVMGSSTVFAALAGSPPTASYITTVNQFVVLSGLASNPYTIHWSSRSDPEEWIIGTNEGDSQTFQDGGLVRGVAGGEYGLVFQDNVIRRMTYAPGSVIIFDMDRVSEDMGLMAPYSVVRSRDIVLFLSHLGFQMWHPAQGFTPIGKERIDRTFFADADTDSKQLIIGANDPTGTRTWFAYKSVIGTTGLFDSIIVYDWQLDRWSKIVGQQGEYLASAATPGITLENLDSISASIDALSVSLDDFATSFSNKIAMCNSSHMIGLFTGPNLEAVLETNDMNMEHRVFVRAARPVTDAATVYGSLTTLRQKIADTPAFSTEYAMNDVGFTPHRIDTRLARFRNRIPAGTVWNFSAGLEPELTNSGRR
jgi:hypothetical protein